MTGGSPDPSTTTVRSGVDALVQLLVLRHQLDERDGLTTATMVSGYPGSPLGTFDLAVDHAADVLASHRVLHRPGLNEELAAATVWGSQMGAAVDYVGVDGVAGVWYGKTPGLDRAGDALKHANAMGAGPNGGVVLFCGDDPSAKSSTLPCDSQFTFQDACVPVLYPGNQQELVDLGVHAFRLSRYCGAWVGLKVVTAVADGIGSVDLDPGRHPSSPDPEVEIEGRTWRHQPQATIGPHAVPDQEALVVDHRLRAAEAYAAHHRLDRVVGAAAGARLGIVCAGKTYYDVLQAFADLGVAADDLGGLGVRVLKLAMTYPVSRATLLDFASSVDEVLVVEEKRPFVESQVRTILHEARHPVPVLGKRGRTGETLASTVRELDPAAVAAILTTVLPDLAPAAEPEPTRISLPILELPPRPPGFCSGCPHNRSTVAPAGALVGGGVGCHGIMYFEERQRETRRLPPTPMGAEGVPWIGLAPFVADPHLVQNIGDGTLSHSGTLAIRASVAAGVNVTFKVLYNAAVAMTGGQDVTGLLDVPSMTRALEAEGVQQIVVCAEDPGRYGRGARWGSKVEVVGRDHLPEVQERLREVPGVTVIVYDQRCAAEARRLRKRGLLEEPDRRVVINEAVCEGCGDCGTKSNCLSVLPLETELGEKRQIDDLSCNRDYTCLDGDCPSFVTFRPAKRRRPGRVTGRRPGAVEQGRPRPSRPTGTLPLPSTPTVVGSYGIYFTGIGGTGVVTANRLLATAAEATGFTVGGMDQTGLSQKAGAVVSHLNLSTDAGSVGSASVTHADLYLSGDILQAAGAAHLDKVDPGTTLAVVDRTMMPTASMLQRDAAPLDRSVLEQAIVDRVGDGRVLFVDAKRIADDVFANHLVANIVLLGAAFQLGGLPLSLDDIEQAIAGQGKVAADNREAFVWGRWAAHDAAAVDACLARVEGTSGDAAPNILDPSTGALADADRLVQRRELPSALHELLVRRAAQAIDYQNRARADRFLGLVERAARRDGADHDWLLTRTLAASWFKLLTYKDEYEVARLHLAADYDRMARDLGLDAGYTVTYHLHPPVLRRLGMKKKLPMGRPYAVAFRALRGMRRLRGTPFDLFGLDPDRRTERGLIEEFERVMTDALGSTGSSYEQLVALADSAASIRGYGPIKERAVDEWRQRIVEGSGAATGDAEPVGVRE